MFEHPLWWIGFSVFVVAMLALDLGVFHKHSHVVKTREALRWTATWVTLALGFNVWVYYAMGAQRGTEFLTAYLVEQSLSIDNVFVIYLIFRYFKVEPQYQHRVLFWGIIGAFVMRLGFIVAGIALIKQFHWLIYVFGGILIVSGIKMAFSSEPEVHPERNPLLKLVRKFIPISNDYHGKKFIVVHEGRKIATPMLAVLLIIETTDLIFAVDSIPAVLAITQDPFIAFTSNVFAILGLRSLYFAVAGMVEKFYLLHYGLSFVLVFIGGKMLLPLVSNVHLPTWASLIVIVVSVSSTITASLIWPQKEAH